MWTRKRARKKEPFGTSSSRHTSAHGPFEAGTQETGPLRDPPMPFGTSLRSKALALCERKGLAQALVL
ncbi:hypothetical protein BGZ61DRAFT_466018 [Ilyonectria robusta]|uniref:uncharacterized protein n=1 Tax=Ilyonectria robusta TaxID=1079257 RepID=UPI001E8D6DA5|nr:uncharacterized protein BGZ61DRAFT_466018 [Ilyonectria robusta]KAH8657274.1 hypothetical protein BGZ61DRAFT_466018 [Ilyonectria robusta]